MTLFTEDEQWYSDLEWFAVDKNGNIGQFLTGGNRFLPPSFSSHKELSERLSDFFADFPSRKDNFIFCPDLEKNMRELRANEINEKFMPSCQKMASKGLFSYDSDNYTYKNRPYFRVTIPKNPLKLTDLPQNIRDILENLRINEINFAEDSLIPEEITNRL